MNKILLILAAGLMVCAFIIGCSTEDPWQPDPSRPLALSIVSGPADTVAYGSTISFSWTSRGGVPEVTYQYRLDSGSWSTPSNVTSVTYEDVIAGATFSVMATDGASDTDEASRAYEVGAPDVDADAPSVSIVSSPAEGSFVATGSAVTITWEGMDEVDGDNLMYWYSFAGSTSDTSAATTAVFTNVTAGDVTFSVWAHDQSGNPSAAATVSFTIKDASILYVDDYQWFDLAGNVDMPKERDQKQFYRDVLEGYAFAEWDIALQGMPDSSDLVVGGEPVYSTIVFASDTDVGSSDGTWWYEVGAPGESSIHHYMESGGKLIAAGGWILPWMYNSNPPVAGDFEFEWFGVDSVGNDDGVAWDYWSDFTWAVNAGNMAGLPDSMKIDVGKNGDQLGAADNIFSFRDSCVVLFIKGLDVDGHEPHDYGASVGHIFYPGGGDAVSAMINFDVYSMPLDGMRQTIRTILTEYGE
jgi:hypothetical protein